MFFQEILDLLGLKINKPLKAKAHFGGIFEVWCYDKEGKLKWYDQTANLVVNEGLDYILECLFQSATSDPWYIGLTDGTPTVAAADTLSPASHVGWTEVTDYSEGARQEFVDGVIASQSVNNSASKASFSISGSVTIGGAFMADSASTGANGRLLCGAVFTGGDKIAASGDTLEVQYTFSSADDGV